MAVMQEESQTDNIGILARRAFGWRSLGQGINTFVVLLSGIVLARLLRPADFGIVAMVLIVTDFAKIFRSLGLFYALIQRKDIQRKHEIAAFWCNFPMGGIICAILVLGAPTIGAFFHEPRMVSVLQVVSLSFVIMPFGIVPSALLQRRLEFKRPFISEACGDVGYGVVGLTMALAGYGYWSLAGAQLAQVTIQIVAICVMTGYVPPLVPSLRGLRDLYGFGVGVTGTGLMNYVAQQVDYFVVGRWVNSAALGLYTRAFVLANYPAKMAGVVLYPVLLPAFSHLQSDREESRRAYSRITTAVSLCAFPLLTLLAVTAPELIPVVFGPQWTASVLPTQILVCAGMLRTMVNSGSALATGFGKVYEQMWRQGVYAAVLGTGAFLGLKWGIIGVAWAVLMATAIIGVLMAHLVFRCIGFGLRDHVVALRGPVAIAVIVLSAAAATRHFLVGSIGNAVIVLVITLAVSAIAGIVGFLLLPFPECRTALPITIPVGLGLSRRRRNAAP
jgi:O-antigen/teichoic acid export membrane protein